MPGSGSREDEGEGGSIYPRERLPQGIREEEKKAAFQQRITKRSVGEWGIARLICCVLRQGWYMRAAKSWFQALATTLVPNFRGLGSVF